MVNGMGGRRTFPVVRFGISNLDHPIYIETAPVPKVLALNLVDENNETLDPNAPFVLDYTYNTTFQSRKVDKVKYYRSSTSALMLRLEDNKVAYLNASDFEKAKYEDRGADVQMNVIDLTNMSAGDLERLLTQ